MASDKDLSPEEKEEEVETERNKEYVSYITYVLLSMHTRSSPNGVLHCYNSPHTNSTRIFVLMVSCSMCVKEEQQPLLTQMVKMRMAIRL